MGQTDPRVERLSRLDACAVSDAMDKLGLAGVVTGLPPLSVARRIAGRVVTVKLDAGTAPPGPTRHLGTTAVAAAGPGEVIVVEQRSGIDAGSWGGILTQGARVRGVAGVIADGPVRDIDEAKALDFPVYARSCTARTARGRVVERGTNVPVRIGEIEVTPGDFVIADGSAVVFIPGGEIDRVLEAAQYIADREAAMAEAIRAGQPITEVMGASYEHLLGKS
ncbi:MAG: RraA family protein [Betaproteobacteria bacterium]|nr:RraA family protein [Betaproteobacteria bacterium]